MASKKYIKDYDLVETEDTNGRVRKTAVYRGEYFRLNLEESQIKKNKWQFILLFVAALGLHILAGLVYNPGLNQLYTALPYTASFFPLLFLAEGIFRIPSQKRPYRNEEIGLSYRKVINMSRLYLIFMAVGFIGLLVYLVFIAKGLVLQWETIYPGVVLGMALLSMWIIYRKATRIKIEKEETPSNSE
ncbi:MAG: hypothetical protein PHW11_03945 [Anaerolineaceae bacterium]|jgi:hypothetical protein|nr:hypothetical protein [Anaerolineaceae bacterium]MDD4042643.1 hypothetical protein [Anaerolineaceae bacterium]MDD4577818.1 hypothetical protein [Anaerolineaceae bacterium]